MATYVTGVTEIVVAIADMQKSFASGFQRGIVDAGAFLLAESKKFVPIEYGDLINSGYSRLLFRGFYSEVYVGYTEPYAIWVHENIQMKLKGVPRPSGIGRYWDPNGRPKFLEEPARRLTPTLLNIIGRAMKVP